MDKLSVIIPSRNEAENLEQCICEILEGDCQPCGDKSGLEQTMIEQFTLKDI